MGMMKECYFKPPMMEDGKTIDYSKCFYYDEVTHFLIYKEGHCYFMRYP